MIPVAQPTIGEKEARYVAEAVQSTWVSSAGAFIDRFEEGLRAYFSSPFVTTTSNGTAALHLALLALDIGPGDEVIIPASSFIATLNVVLYTGATPVFVDIEMDTWGMDPAQVKAAITPKTKAIIAVHLYGFSCRIKELREIADRHHLFLIEDNAESFGGTADGKKLGTVGDIGTFSFFGNKIITTGEGGAVCTNRQDLYDKMLLFKNHGRKGSKTYHHEVRGYNYRMTNLQAALGCAQLEQVDAFLADRARVERGYTQELRGVVGMQQELPGTTHVMWMYTVLLTDSQPLAAVQDHLQKNGVDSRAVFAPMNTMPYLPADTRKQLFPNAQYIADHGLTLPTYVGLSEKDVDTVTAALLGYKPVL